MGSLVRAQEGELCKSNTYRLNLVGVFFCVVSKGDSNFVYSAMKKLILLFWAICISTVVNAQKQSEPSVPLSKQTLFDRVADLDSALFEAYNSENLELMKTYFTKDLEWYQDNGGLILFDQVFANFQSIFDREYTLKRTLIKESLEVHPIDGFGAIEIGSHQFEHTENGKLEVGTFKFLMIWKNDQGTWRISRVVSFDH